MLYSSYIEQRNAKKKNSSKCPLTWYNLWEPPTSLHPGKDLSSSEDHTSTTPAQPTIKSVRLMSRVGATNVAVAWTHRDALFLTERLNNSCSRRLKHLPRKSHSTICWVTPKVFDLSKKVQSQWNVNERIHFWGKLQRLTPTWIDCPTSKPSALGCFI